MQTSQDLILIIANVAKTDTKQYVNALIFSQKLAYIAERHGYRSQNLHIDDSFPSDHIGMVLFVGEKPSPQLAHQYSDYPQNYIPISDDDEFAFHQAYIEAKKLTAPKVESHTTQPLRFVAITACPTGVAHTFMAADALKQCAEKLGYLIEVETQGSVGAKNILSEDAIAQADYVILATDIEVDTSRFAEKKIYRCGTGFALKQTEKAFQQAIKTAKISRSHTPKSQPQTKEKISFYKHLMTGVSFMLPIVVAGGLLIALSFVFGLEAFKQQGSLADILQQTGKAAFTLMIPILSGYIAYSVADRPGLAAGLIGGLLSSQIGAGFLGAILSGFIAGYSALLIAQKFPLPQSMQALKPILIIPLFSSLIVGLTMYYIVGEPTAQLFSMMENFLNNMGMQNAILMGIIIGAMMCFDMGGPINKAAYTFSVGLLTIDTPNQFPIAIAMASGMVPPIGMAFATFFAHRKFNEDERNMGKASLVLGLCFLSEGAIPFAAKDPIRVLPSCILGGIITGALVAYFQVTLAAPHGGIFVLLIPNAVTHMGEYLFSILAGSIVTGISYALLKRSEKNRTV